MRPACNYPNPVLYYAVDCNNFVSIYGRMPTAVRLVTYLNCNWVLRCDSQSLFLKVLRSTSHSTSSQSTCDKVLSQKVVDDYLAYYLDLIARYSAINLTRVSFLTAKVCSSSRRHWLSGHATGEKSIDGRISVYTSPRGLKIASPVLR
jgi:hypothetical protein